MEHDKAQLVLGDSDFVPVLGGTPAGVGIHLDADHLAGQRRSRHGEGAGVDPLGSSGEWPVVPMTRGLPQAAASSSRARVAWCELKSTTASTDRIASRRSSPRSVAAAIATPMPGAASATARPILPRAPFSRILRAMAEVSAGTGRRPARGWRGWRAPYGRAGGGPRRCR